MKNILAFLSMVIFSASAFSITATTGKIAKLNIENGVVLVKMASTLSTEQRWSCGNPTAAWWDFAFDPKTEEGKVMTSFVLSAYAAGKDVSIMPEHQDTPIGSACSVASNTQNAKSIVLQ
jgi:hypothetical protein